MNMEGKTFQIYEWRIENFSCWNQVVHGDCLESPKFAQHGYVQRMSLRPRVENFRSICMEIGCFGAKYLPLNEKVSAIGADGSFFPSIVGTCPFGQSNTPFVKIPNLSQSNNLFLFDFEKYVTKFKNMKTRYEDRLTVRISIVSEEAYVDIVNTTLEVVKISLNIDTKLIESMESDYFKYISIIRYNNRNYLDELLLKATRKNETVKLILHLLSKTTNGVLVESQLSIIHESDNTLVRNEGKVFLYRNCEPWTFSNSLKMTALVYQDIAILLSLKITTGNIIDEIPKSSQDDSTVSKKNIYFFDRKSTKNSGSVASNKTADPVSALTQDFMCLYQDQKFSDLLLICDKVSFPVHRAILSARSPVFERLLSSDMAEASSGKVDITDLGAPTLSHFLTFLYTGAVVDLQGESAIKLYYAADKYLVATLKAECSALLCANVNLSNVCDILSLAYKHQDKELTSAVHNFILENYNAVLGSEKWRNFLKMDPLLAAETLTDLAAKFSVGKIGSQ